MLIKKLSSKEVAEKYNLPIHIVHKWALKNHIPKQTLGGKTVYTFSPFQINNILKDYEKDKALRGLGRTKSLGMQWNRDSHNSLFKRGPWKPQT